MLIAGNLKLVSHSMLTYGESRLLLSSSAMFMKIAILTTFTR